LDGARAFVGHLPDIATDVLGQDRATATENTRLLLVDLKHYIEPALKGEQEALTREDFAEYAGMHPTTLDKRYRPAGLGLTECAAALPMLFGAHGRLGDRLIYLMQALKSPVGKDVTGPSIIKDDIESSQGMFGPMLCEPDGYVHSLIGRPRCVLDPQSLVLQITEEMLGQLLRVSATIRTRCKNRAAFAQLSSLKIDPDALMRRTSCIDLLLPRLGVGSDTGRGRLDYLYADVKALRTWMESGDNRPGIPASRIDAPKVGKAVVEITDKPHHRDLKWENGIDLWAIVTPLASTIGLQMSFDTDARYAFEYDRHGRLAKAHRELAIDAPLSVATLGFDGGVDDATRDDGELARVICYMEAIAARGRAEQCAEGVGQRFAPAHTQINGTPGRRFVESMRTVQAEAFAYADKV
jgi:hypothetical protein